MVRPSRGHLKSIWGGGQEVGAHQRAGSVLPIPADRGSLRNVSAGVGCPPQRPHRSHSGSREGR